MITVQEYCEHCGDYKNHIVNPLISRVRLRENVPGIFSIKAQCVDCKTYNDHTLNPREEKPLIPSENLMFQQ